MDLSRVLERIERRLKVVGKSANAVSKEAGKPDAIRNLQRAIKSGERQGATVTTISALAGPLLTSASWLIEATGPEEVGGIEQTIPVWGKAGAGGAVFNFHETDVPIDRIPAPEGSDEKTSAIQIDGDSLGRIFNGWFAIYNEVENPPTYNLLGRLCLLQIASGQVYIKKLRKGRGKRFTLESNYEAPIENVEVLWAAKIITVKERF